MSSVVQLICLDHEIFHHLTPILTPSLTLTPMMRRTQALYGIIQGGIYEDLRDESTAFINQHAFFGTAIGGSLGASKKNMHDIVAYTRARVRDDRPVHLLGIGGVRDIFHGVRHGIDTFDCVHPSRLARHGGALGENSAVLLSCTRVSVCVYVIAEINMQAWCAPLLCSASCILDPIQYQKYFLKRTSSLYPILSPSHSHGPSLGGGAQRGRVRHPHDPGCGDEETQDG